MYDSVASSGKKWYCKQWHLFIMCSIMPTVMLRSSVSAITHKLCSVGHSNHCLPLEWPTHPNIEHIYTNMSRVGSLQTFCTGPLNLSLSLSLSCGALQAWRLTSSIFHTHSSAGSSPWAWFILFYFLHIYILPCTVWLLCLHDVLPAPRPSAGMAQPRSAGRARETAARPLRARSMTKRAPHARFSSGRESVELCKCLVMAANIRRKGSPCWNISRMAEEAIFSYPLPLRAAHQHKIIKSLIHAGPDYYILFSIS